MIHREGIMGTGWSTVLIVDDDPVRCGILSKLFLREGHTALAVRTGTRAAAEIQNRSIDCVVFTSCILGMSEREFVGAIRNLANPPGMVLLSDHGTEPTKPVDGLLVVPDEIRNEAGEERILATVRKAIRRMRLEREHAGLSADSPGQVGLIGRGPGIRRVFELICKAAKTHSKVLIEGENGTGKELAARAIHALGTTSRAGGSFVAVNCAAIPETLIESELFGYRKGAFTGAFEDKPGKFHAADGGTLFLDEIGDMTRATQAKVLRAMEDGFVQPLGARRPESVRVRLIAATNKELRREVREGRFREDLYFRIHVLLIRLPPLRERQEDIHLLTDHFLGRFCDEYGVPAKHLTPDAMDILIRHSWPGNVRELKNTVEKMVVLIEDTEIRDADAKTILAVSDRPLASAAAPPVSWKKAKEEFERDYLKKTLKAEGWNFARTAERLEIGRTYLYRKMKQLGLDIIPGSEFGVPD
jgi:two-component system, NtrC family, nitrogen regulation response regulator NtrX